MNWIRASNKSRKLAVYVSSLGVGVSTFGVGAAGSAAQEIQAQEEISASVHNFFDTHFSEPGGPEHLLDVIPQEGRQFRVKATWAF